MKRLYARVMTLARPGKAWQAEVASWLGDEARRSREPNSRSLAAQQLRLIRVFNDVHPYYTCLMVPLDGLMVTV